MPPGFDMQEFLLDNNLSKLDEVAKGLIGADFTDEWTAAVTEIRNGPDQRYVDMVKGLLYYCWKSSS